ncbi:hypothetical protein AVEN_187187-1 [Araneus ventricosus]|uniref:Uncharacterized protein n=1 Tax=Araneus ventricosus TaxID=182803 RepID=A0A4Y2H7W8_ARAVE|nr:hypothetical protein AVEN_186518-1 [Araneus ventricosus]GBM62215.1 hypothetical protein AVEN_187187-1 [Araneus ventricosus]
MQQSVHEFLYFSSTRMCPEKCVTPHSESVAGRTDFLAHSKQLTCKKGSRLKDGPPPFGQALTGFNGPTSLTFVGKFVTQSLKLLVKHVEVLPEMTTSEQEL